MVTITKKEKQEEEAALKDGSYWNWDYIPVAYRKAMEVQFSEVEKLKRLLIDNGYWDDERGKEFPSVYDLEKIGIKVVNEKKKQEMHNLLSKAGKN